MWGVSTYGSKESLSQLLATSSFRVDSDDGTTQRTRQAVAITATAHLWLRGGYPEAPVLQENGTLQTALAQVHN